MGSIVDSKTNQPQPIGKGQSGADTPSSPLKELVKALEYIGVWVNENDYDVLEKFLSDYRASLFAEEAETEALIERADWEGLDR